MMFDKKTITANVCIVKRLCVCKTMTCDLFFVPAVPAGMTACWVSREGLLSLSFCSSWNKAQQGVCEWLWALFGWFFIKLSKSSYSYYTAGWPSLCLRSKEKLLFQLSRGLNWNQHSTNEKWFSLGLKASDKNWARLLPSKFLVLY